jgi:hypothetical protein
MGGSEQHSKITTEHTMKTILQRTSLLLATVACLKASEDPKTAIWLVIAALLGIFSAL